MRGERRLSETVYFLSDTHFKYHAEDSLEKKKRSLFSRFLQSIEGCSRLYLVGDIFDFWFEYGSVIPRYYGNILDSIGRLAGTGTEVFLTGGNHDHWFGSYLPETYGIELLPPAAVHTIQGRRVMITHGDNLLPGDYGYKALKALIRSRPVVSLARLIHPDLLYAIAGSFSRTSKGLTRGKTEACAETLVRMAEESFFNDGNDAFVMGHVHLPRLIDFEGRIFIILGDWETHFSYARLEEGVFTLGRYQSVGDTVSENL
jgi:UDP-2,3-diacylglucosamine hydrolase